MARSQAAKELAAQQKAQRKAEKLRKKTSTNPDDWSTFKRIKWVFDETRKFDDKLVLISLLAFCIPLIIGLTLGLVLMLVFHWNWFTMLLWIILGVMTGLMVLLQVLGKRAKNSQFTRYEGQRGASEIALQMLPKGWTHKAGVAFNKQQDMVHRVVGPGGVILVGEGETSRIQTLLSQEAKRTQQVLYSVTPITIITGDKAGQVPFRKLTKHIVKLPNTLSKDQIEQATKRLEALDRQRGRMPIPKGPLPNPGVSRRAMRGR